MMARTLGKSLNLFEPQSYNLSDGNDTCSTYYCELSHRHEIHFAKCKILWGITSLPTTNITIPTRSQPNPRKSLISTILVL